MLKSVSTADEEAHDAPCALTMKNAQEDTHQSALHVLKNMSTADEEVHDAPCALTMKDAQEDRHFWTVQ